MSHRVNAKEIIKIKSKYKNPVKQFINQMAKEQMLVSYEKAARIENGRNVQKAI